MGLLRTATKVAVASSVHGRVQHRQHERWSQQDAQAAQVAAAQAAQAATVQAAAPAPVAAPPAEDALVGQLRQLAELRDAGILTEEEFSAKKAKLLGI